MTAELEFAGVTKHFGSKVALDGFDHSGGSGVIGLLGPNGAGKTTLLRMLATVLAPDQGTIRVFGLDPARSGDRLAIRRMLGYLPQETGLYPGFSGFDLVDYVAVLKEIKDSDTRHEEVRRVLCAVGLEDDMHRRIRTLSGGMKRRVAIAAALVGQPRLLVLDEPSAGLDPDQRLRLRDVVSQAGQHGTAVVSTHQTDEIAALCQQVLVLDRGRLRFAGTPRELAALAEGRVWVDDHDHPGAIRSWVTSDGLVRSIGTPPSGVQLVDPNIDDGYLFATSDATSNGAPS
jgi:ABC-2 type transport system ATP-binding protein